MNGKEQFMLGDCQEQTVAFLSCPFNSTDSVKQGKAAVESSLSTVWRGVCVCVVVVVIFLKPSSGKAKLTQQSWNNPARFEICVCKELCHVHVLQTYRPCR